MATACCGGGFETRSYGFHGAALVGAGLKPAPTPIRTRSHRIAQCISLTACFGPIIGEMVVSNCARRLAGRISLSRTIRAASTRAVQRDQRAGLMHHLQLVLLINIRRYVELTAENYETKLTILAKTNPIQRRPSVAGRPR